MTNQNNNETKQAYTLTMKYEIKSEDSCTKIIEAESMKAACEELKDWLRDGAWGDEPVVVSGTVYALDHDGDRTGESENVEVEINAEAAEPECAEGCEHDWQSPHEIVGGLDSNPGVWSIGGSKIKSLSVCVHCGLYRDYVSGSAPGQYPRTPECTSYRETDETSTAWVEEMAK